MQEQSIEINATLIFQAFNFFIAYIIVRKLLLRPAIDALEADAIQKSQLEQKIDTRALANNAQEDAMRYQWQEFQRHISAKFPAFIQMSHSVMSEDVEYQELAFVEPSKESVDFMAKSLARGLISRIDHVRS